METIVSVKRPVGRPRTSTDPRKTEASRRRDAEYRRNRNAKRREHLIEYLGGECEVTGSTENLEAHHIFPMEKDFEIFGGANLNHRTMEELEAEARKCVLLCRAEHTRIHNRVKEIMREIEKDTDLTEEARKSLMAHHTRNVTRTTIVRAKIKRELDSL